MRGTCARGLLPNRKPRFCDATLHHRCAGSGRSGPSGPGRASMHGWAVAVPRSETQLNSAGAMRDAKDLKHQEMCRVDLQSCQLQANASSGTMGRWPMRLPWTTTQRTSSVVLGSCFLHVPVSMHLEQLGQRPEGSQSTNGDPSMHPDRVPIDSGKRRYRKGLLCAPASSSQRGPLTRPPRLV